MLYSIIPFRNHIMFLQPHDFPKGSLKFHLFLKTNTISLLTGLFAHSSLPAWPFFCVSLTESCIRALCKKKKTYTADAKSHSTPHNFHFSGLDCASVHCIQSQHQERWRPFESEVWHAWSRLGKWDSVIHRCTDTCKSCRAPFPHLSADRQERWDSLIAVYWKKSLRCIMKPWNWGVTP